MRIVCPIVLLTVACGSFVRGQRQLRANANTLSDPSSQETPQQRQTTTHGAERSRVIVTYRNEQGKQDILQRAGTVYYDYPEDNTIVVDLDEDSILTLGSQENIETIEEDEVWEMFNEWGSLKGPYDRELLARKKKEKKPKKNKKRVVVKYLNDEGRQGVLKNSGNVYYSFSDDNVIVLDLDEDDISSLVNDANVLAIDEDYIYTAQGVYEGEYNYSGYDGRHLAESVPYGVAMVQGNQVDVGSFPVRVCITDTGVARRHPDLPTTVRGASRTQASGTRLLWRQDMVGHGTHVSGTVVAVGGNDIGVVGVADGASLYMTRALGNDGTARESDIYDAMKQCVDAGAHIISMSLGGGGISTSFKQLLDQVYYEKNILIVAAAGNNGKAMAMYPAAYGPVISVSAVRQDYTRWDGSNYDPSVELAAPGDLVLSTCINSKGEFTYCYYSGTSMATPHVAGVAALLKSNYPSCTNDQIRYAMAKSALDLSDVAGASNQQKDGCDDKFGYGLVQAKNAMNFLASNPCSNGWGKRNGNTVTGGCTIV